MDKINRDEHNGQKWTKMNKDGQKSIEINRNGQKWTKMDRNEQKWTEIYRNGQKWTKVNRNGQKWTEMDRNEQSWEKCPQAQKLVTYFPRNIFYFLLLNRNMNRFIFAILSTTLIGQKLSNQPIRFLSLAVYICPWKIRFRWSSVGCT